MKTKLQLHLNTLQLKHTFTISRGSRDAVDSLIVALKAKDVTGFGEATANPYYHSTTQQMADRILAIKSSIEQLEWVNPLEFSRWVEKEFADQPFIQCALNNASFDLKSRIEGKTLRNYLGFSEDKKPLSNYTIGLDTIDRMIAKIKEQPWPIYKIKLGTNDDMNIIRALRKETSSLFRIDANCAWTAAETIERSIELKDLGVEFIEQPMPANQWEQMKAIKNKSALPIIADESCCTLEDVAKCQDAFHGINIKLMKCGGIPYALQMIQEARKFGLQVMMGCMTESSIGISTIAQFSGTLDYIDLDGAMLIKNDPAHGIKLKSGEIIYSNTAGIGAQLFKQKN